MLNKIFHRSIFLYLFIAVCSNAEINNQLGGVNDFIFSGGFESNFLVGGETTTANITVKLNQFPNYQISSIGSYSIPHFLTAGSPYQVDIISSPTSQLCSLKNNTGVVGFNNIMDVDISCGEITTVYEIKQGNIAGNVALENVIVTGCKENLGYWIQTIPGDLDYIGDDFSGVFVFKNDLICSGEFADVNEGDRININPGMAIEFFGQTLVVHDSLEILSNNNVLPSPVIETPANLAGTSSVPLEGVLVQVQNVLVTDLQTPPGNGESNPSNSFEIDNSLIVDDIIYLTEPFPQFTDSYDEITGIMMFRNGISKLLPRFSQDVFQASIFSDTLVINEIDYDQINQDTTEFIEIFNPTNSTVSLNNVSLYLINGVTNSDYYHYDLDSHGSLASGQYLVLGSQNMISDVASGALTQLLDEAIQNGPDGLVLIDKSDNSVIDSVSYEGDIFNATLTGLGVMVDITEGSASVADQSNAVGSVSRITNGMDTDDNSSDFVFTHKTTPGGANVLELSPDFLVLNEVDYNQVGADDEEYIEIYNPTNFPISLVNTSVYLINGSSNTDYDHYDFDALGSIQAGQYLVLGSSNMLNDVPSAALTQTFNGLSNQIQNGTPEGIVLINRSSNTAIDGVSYGGNLFNSTITNLAITVDVTEVTSSLIDDASMNGSLSRKPNEIDTNNNDNDWIYTTSLTPGEENIN